MFQVGKIFGLGEGSCYALKEWQPVRPRRRGDMKMGAQLPYVLVCTMADRVQEVYHLAATMMDILNRISTKTEIAFVIGQGDAFIHCQVFTLAGRHCEPTDLISPVSSGARPLTTRF